VERVCPFFVRLSKGGLHLKFLIEWWDLDDPQGGLRVVMLPGTPHDLHGEDEKAVRERLGMLSEVHPDEPMISDVKPLSSKPKSRRRGRG
jgi:hypothetical protein